MAYDQSLVKKRMLILLRFLAAVIGSRLFRYLAFHAGSNFGVGRDQLHVYETLALPFPPPDHELVPEDSDAIVHETARIIKEVERAGKNATAEKRINLVNEAWIKIQPLVENYFSVTDAERILIEDTLNLYQPSIHCSSLDSL